MFVRQLKVILLLSVKSVIGSNLKYKVMKWLKSDDEYYNRPSKVSALEVIAMAFFLLVMVIVLNLIF
jgi:hypothetical protein